MATADRSLPSLVKINVDNIAHWVNPKYISCIDIATSTDYVTFSTIHVVGRPVIKVPTEEGLRVLTLLADKDF